MKLRNRLLDCVFVGLGCVVILTLVLVFRPGREHVDKDVSSGLSEALAEANQDFTYKGTAIHPKLIQEFEIWLSDYCPPVTVSVDVIAATQARNEYESTGIITVGDTWFRYNSEEQGYYEYRRLGTLESGIHVLETAYSGGGSGIFMGLLFVRFAVDKPYNLDGLPYERLLLQVVGDYGLGDRDNGSIEVLDDRVIVGASRYRKQQVELVFE